MLMIFMSVYLWEKISVRAGTTGSCPRLVEGHPTSIVRRDTRLVCFSTSDQSWMDGSYHGSHGTSSYRNSEQSCVRTSTRRSNLPEVSSIENGSGRSTNASP